MIPLKHAIPECIRGGYRWLRRCAIQIDVYFILLYFTSRGLQNREKQNIILIEEIMFLAATFL